MKPFSAADAPRITLVTRLPHSGKLCGLAAAPPRSLHDGRIIYQSPTGIERDPNWRWMYRPPGRRALLRGRRRFADGRPMPFGLWPDDRADRLALWMLCRRIVRDFGDLPDVGEWIEII